MRHRRIAAALAAAAALAFTPAAADAATAADTDIYIATPRTGCDLSLIHI